MGVLLPYIVAPSAAGIIFSQVFSDKMGAINVLLQQIGMQPIMWHGNTFWSHVAIATIVNWRYIGYNTLILLAAMQAIPRDVLEAAVVDGAGKWRTFRSVTLPMLRPTLIFVIITSTIGGLQIFDEPQMFHNGASAGGGANNQYLTVSLYLYKLGFVMLSFGVLVYLYYDWSLKQAMCMRDVLANGAGRMEVHVGGLVPVRMVRR